MLFAKRLAATLEVAFTALFPGEGEKAPPPPAPSRHRSNGTDRSFLASPESFLTAGGDFRRFVPSVYPLAAPFILFRLKRKGFSGCRVVVSDCGLLVTARR